MVSDFSRYTETPSSDHTIVGMVIISEKISEIQRRTVTVSALNTYLYFGGLDPPVRTPQLLIYTGKNLRMLRPS